MNFRSHYWSAQLHPYIYSLFCFLFYILYLIFMSFFLLRYTTRWDSEEPVVAVKYSKVVLQQLYSAWMWRLTRPTIYNLWQPLPDVNNSLLLSDWVVFLTSLRNCVEIKLHLGIKSRRDLCKMLLFCF